MHCIYYKEYGQSMAGNNAFRRSINVPNWNIKKLSKKHVLYCDRCMASRAAPLPAAFQRQAAANRSSEESEMIIKFNTTYNLAKEELPFTKFKSQIIYIMYLITNVYGDWLTDLKCIIGCS